MTARKKSPAGRGLAIRNSTAEFLIFTGQAGEESIEVRFENQTIWLTQKLMAELFAVTVPAISQHLKGVFESGELDEPSAVKTFLTTAADGKNYQTRHYNLDVVISVGYRVNSVRATQFRQWATQVLREFAIKGWVLDRKRLENGSFLGEDCCTSAGKCEASLRTAPWLRGTRQRKPPWPSPTTSTAHWRQETCRSTSSCPTSA